MADWTDAPFVYRGQKKLRRGYTTGTCAAAVAAGAARMLLSGKPVSEVKLRVPEGSTLCLSLVETSLSASSCSCGVVKDSGDDPDITNGSMVCAKVSFAHSPGLVLTGGVGVGRVTKPGLSVPVGEPAINPVPRKMILEGVETVCREYGYTGGLVVEISVPEGEALAARTFNPRLGIVGGISILGTSGIVEPMSEEALVASIGLEIRMAVKNGSGYLLLVPGNYGEDFVKEHHLADHVQPVKCSNYVGESLDMAVREGAKGVLFVAHIGKFVKLAEGMMNTHSAYGDCRMAILCAEAVRAGAPREVLPRILESVTTDEALRILQEAGFLESVMQHLMEHIEGQLTRRAAGKTQVGAIVFSNVYGVLGQTGQAEVLLRHLQENGK